MTTVAMIGAGHMGAGIGWALRAGGHDVITSLALRSARTARLATQAGLRVVPSLAESLRQAEVILVVTPPAAALTVAADIAALASSLSPSQGQRRIVVDLNATSPGTARTAAEIITTAGLDFVDGSLSGAPPTVRPGATVYLSGPRAAEVAALRWTHVNPIVVGERVGAASAVKMCTASVYKGQIALLTQAMRTAAANGVLDLVLADLGDGYGSPAAVASAAAKAQRYVGEMHEIASTQAAAGLTPSLFESMADVWTEVAGTALGAGDPESVAPSITAQEVVDRLRADGAR
jgi:3-hydroxyisobutyrate dehydrogenase-like beta-hydroxyacid dehydrogenase